MNDKHRQAKEDEFNEHQRKPMKRHNVHHKSGKYADKRSGDYGGELGKKWEDTFKK